MKLTSSVRAAINRRAHAIGHVTSERARSHLVAELDAAAESLNVEQQLELVDRLASTLEGKPDGSSPER